MLQENFIDIYPQLNEKVILNVDDNDMNQLVIVRILQNVGTHTIAAKNGKEAVQLLEDGLKPDVILMDLEMPLMNGFQTSEYIRKHIDSSVPIIINSGLVTGFDKFKLRRLNVTDFLEKPYSMKDIFSKIAKNLPEMQVV